MSTYESKDALIADLDSFAKKLAILILSWPEKAKEVLMYKSFIVKNDDHLWGTRETLTIHAVYVDKFAVSLDVSQIQLADAEKHRDIESIRHYSYLIDKLFRKVQIRYITKKEYKGIFGWYTQDTADKTTSVKNIVYLFGLPENGEILRKFKEEILTSFGRSFDNWRNINLQILERYRLQGNVDLKNQIYDFNV